MSVEVARYCHIIHVYVVIAKLIGLDQAYVIRGHANEGEDRRQLGLLGYVVERPRLAT